MTELNIDTLWNDFIESNSKDKSKEISNNNCKHCDGSSENFIRHISEI